MEKETSDLSAPYGADVLSLSRKSGCRRQTQIRCFFIFLLSSVFYCFAADTPSDWVLAAEKFSFTQLGVRDERESEFASTLPALILESISTTASRMVPQDEMVDRKLSKLQSERNSFFLQLSKEVKTRDSYVVSKLKPRELKKSIKDQQKKITEIQEKIDKNLEETKKIKEQGLVEEEKKRVLFLPIFLQRKKEYEAQAERITLYKNDMTALFNPTAEAAEDGIFSRLYEKEAESAKINGVLSGKITVYGDYVSVTVNLVRYPGCVSLGTITEVGLFTNPIEIAERIAEFFGPRIVNSLPIKIDFFVQPKEAFAKASVTIDDQFHSKVPDSVILDGGIHTVTFDAAGYDTKSITYNFSGMDECALSVKMEETREKVVNIRLKKFSDGTFYANGINFGKSSEEEDTEIKVNGKTVLGAFVSEIDGEQESAFFTINEKKLKDGATYKMNLKPFDRAKNIDKRRKMMYTSYTALICSLPFTFYCLGNNNQAVEAYDLGRIPFNEANSWQTKTLIAGGVTAGCGVWFVIELIRYFKAANDVLPKEP